MKHSDVNNRDTYLYQGQRCYTVGRPDSDPRCQIMMVFERDPDNAFFCDAKELTLAS